MLARATAAALGLVGTVGPDAGSVQLMGDKRPMINALARLGGVQPGELPQAFEAHGINQSQSRFLGLFASHPPIEERIRALQAA